MSVQRHRISCKVRDGFAHATLASMTPHSLSTRFSMRYHCLFVTGNVIRTDTTKPYSGFDGESCGFVVQKAIRARSVDRH